MLQSHGQSLLIVCATVPPHGHPAAPLPCVSHPQVDIKVNPWNFEDKIVLMGDAAHAIVPFFGQV